MGLTIDKDLRVMKAKSAKKRVADEKYYDKRGILGEIVEGEVALSVERRVETGHPLEETKEKIAADPHW